MTVLTYVLDQQAAFVRRLIAEGDTSAFAREHAIALFRLANMKVPEGRHAWSHTRGFYPDPKGEWEATVPKDVGIVVWELVGAP